MHIYFVTFDNGPIKIGMAKNVRTRLNSIQSSIPFKIKCLGVIPNASKDFERQIHVRFAQMHCRGEWFWRMPALVDFIERNCDPYKKDNWGKNESKENG